MEDKFNLKRFIEAQSYSYDNALRELQNGRKTSHWMWYIFPQLRGLGRSYNSNFYGLSGKDEAISYLENPILSERLKNVCDAILGLDTSDAHSVFGGIDSQKLQSSMTLFDIVAPDNLFAAVLEKFFDGRRDRRTIDLIKNIDDNMNIFNFFNRKKDEARQSDKIGTSENQNCPGICDTPLDSQYTPDRINTLGKRDIFVFGSNLAGRHGGGAARIALNRFGAIYGQGEGLQGNSYAIPTMQGEVETIQPYVDRFIEFAKREKALTFYVTKIGCGIAGFKVADIAPLFAEAIAIPNIRLPKEFADHIGKEKIDGQREDLFVHAHGVTRTFADLVIARNKEMKFHNPGEMMSFLRQYFDRFKLTGDDVAFIAVRVFWNVIQDKNIFTDGQLNVEALKERLMGFESHSQDVDHAYESHCREKLFNVVAYLNLFRRYRNADELLRDVNQSGITRFSHCGPNCDYPMSPVRAGRGYPLYYFERFLKENWNELLNSEGTLDAKKLDEQMFNKHERGLRKYGLEAVLAHDYNIYACWGAFTPKKIGTGPVYIDLEEGNYAISCGEGAGPNHIPNYLGYEATAEILKDDSRYEFINGYFIPRYDVTLPILGDWREPWIKKFSNLEEKRDFIDSLRRRTRGC